MFVGARLARRGLSKLMDKYDLNVEEGKKSTVYIVKRTQSTYKFCQARRISWVSALLLHNFGRNK